MRVRLEFHGGVRVVRIVGERQQALACAAALMCAARRRFAARAPQGPRARRPPAARRRSSPPRPPRSASSTSQWVPITVSTPASWSAIGTPAFASSDPPDARARRAGDKHREAAFVEPFGQHQVRAEHRSARRINRSAVVLRDERAAACSSRRSSRSPWVHRRSVTRPTPGTSASRSTRRRLLVLVLVLAGRSRAPVTACSSRPERVAVVRPREVRLQLEPGQPILSARPWPAKWSTAPAAHGRRAAPAPSPPPPQARRRRSRRPRVVARPHHCTQRPITRRSSVGLATTSASQQGRRGDVFRRPRTTSEMLAAITTSMPFRLGSAAHGIR